MVHCFTHETKRPLQSGTRYQGTKKGRRHVSNEYIWETFDTLFKTVHRQGRRVAELEARVADLERRLRKTLDAERLDDVTEPLPAERAA